MSRRGWNRCDDCGKYVRAFAASVEEYGHWHNTCYRCRYPKGILSLGISVEELERSAAEDDHSHDCDPIYAY